jgi:hypothetical protein
LKIVADTLMNNLLKLGLNKWGSLVIEAFLCVEDKVVVQTFVERMFADASDKTGNEFDPVFTLMQNE